MFQVIRCVPTFAWYDDHEIKDTVVGDHKFGMGCGVCGILGDPSDPPNRLVTIVGPCVLKIWQFI